MENERKRDLVGISTTTILYQMVPCYVTYAKLCFTLESHYGNCFVLNLF